jgi:hypothetical protein
MNTNDQKTNRLQALAKRAGDLMVEAYLGGNRERAVFFNKRMKRILWLIYADAQEVIL